MRKRGNPPAGRNDLLDVLADLQRVSGKAPPAVRHLLTQAQERIEDALDNWTSVRYGHNPSLVIFGNPPMRARLYGAGRRMVKRWVVKPFGVVSSNVYEVAYRHAEDGKDYKHDFETPVGLIAATLENVHGTESARIVVLRSIDDLDLWQEF